MQLSLTVVSQKQRVSSCYLHDFFVMTFGTHFTDRQVAVTVRIASSICELLSLISCVNNWPKRELEQEPIGSMYGIFTYVWLIYMVNVGKYTSPMDSMGIEELNNWSAARNFRELKQKRAFKNLSLPSPRMNWSKTWEFVPFLKRHCTRLEQEKSPYETV